MCEWPNTITHTKAKGWNDTVDKQCQLAYSKQVNKELKIQAYFPYLQYEWKYRYCCLTIVLLLRV